MSGRRRAGRLAVIAGLALFGAAACGYPGADVPYVQTPHEVVAEMLRLAGVGRDDVVYDLGSGDGRLVIAAARDFGARGAGIEIDPKLVALSTESARRAGVADRVTFREGDLFQMDLSPATVVTLYLSPELNLRLRPKFLRELRPGARIVSHDYGMGDWAPARTLRMEVRGRVSYIHFWVVPARP
ncbi:MAG: SAM-dependent methyltransferase [Candidatus Rokuibacteriota bacterium]|nr:MAG: SAM-dependent methyltransferase [Candidatus Rokubacteria bacterium]